MKERGLQLARAQFRVQARALLVARTAQRTGVVRRKVMSPRHDGEGGPVAVEGTRIAEHRVGQHGLGERPRIENTVGVAVKRDAVERYDPAVWEEGTAEAIRDPAAVIAAARLVAAERHAAHGHLTGVSAT